MPTTPRNPQPAIAAIKARRLFVHEAASLIGCKTQHLKDVLEGRVRPNDQVRTNLPLITGVPLHELFTADRLNRPYRSPKSSDAA